MLLPTPVTHGGSIEGFVILAAWYSALQAPSWTFVAHTVVATAGAIFWTRWLSRNENHGTARHQSLRWILIDVTICAIVLALLRNAGASIQTTGTLLIPLVVYYALPWFVHTGVTHASPTDSH